MVGSELIGQNFTSDRYFHGRPSATLGPDPSDPTKTVPAPYNAANSMGSNLGPTSKALVDRVKGDVDEAEGRESRHARSRSTWSRRRRSGLDPDITPAARCFQVPRVAKARGLPEDSVRAARRRSTSRAALLGILGEPRVNVLAAQPGAG